MLQFMKRDTVVCCKVQEVWEVQQRLTAPLLMKMLFAVLCLTWLIVPASPCPRVLTIFPTQSGHPCTTLVVRRQRGTARRRSRVVCRMVRRGED